MNPIRKQPWAWLAALCVLGLVVAVPLALVGGQADGEKKTDAGEKGDGDKKAKAREGDGKKRKDGEENENGVRGVFKSLDLKEWTITIVIPKDNITLSNVLKLTKKKLKVTGRTTKLKQIREGWRVYAVLSKADEVVEIRVLRRGNNRLERVFAAYDNNGDEKVTFKEWCAIKEGKFDKARTAREKRYFNQVDTNNNGEISFDEFAAWRNGNRPREDGDKKRGPRDGEGKRKKGAGDEG